MIDSEKIGSTFIILILVQRGFAVDYSLLSMV